MKHLGYDSPFKLTINDITTQMARNGEKTGSFLQTLLRGLRVIGMGALVLAGAVAIAMGLVIAFWDAFGVWNFEWWHLIYWITELFAVAFLIGKTCDDD